MSATRAPATTTETVDARGRLSEAEFRRIVETLLGRPRQRFKDSPHYVFCELTSGQAGQVTAYLRTLAVAYDRETVTRWTP